MDGFRGLGSDQSCSFWDQPFTKDTLLLLFQVSQVVFEERARGLCVSVLHACEGERPSRP